MAVDPDAVTGKRFDTDDGSAYERVDAGQFDSFDDVDSTTIDDPDLDGDGAPG